LKTRPERRADPARDTNYGDLVRIRIHRPEKVAVRGLHLLVLSAFAVAQPLFDLLGDTPEFFVVRGSTTWDIVAFGLGLLLIPPALLLGFETLGGLVHPRVQEVLHLTFCGALAGIVALEALKRSANLSTWLSLAIALAAGALLAVAYAYHQGVRTFLTVLAPAPLAFLALFLVNSPLDKLSFESDAHAGARPALHATVPVVLVVFDELPSSSLMDEHRKIDAVRYPSFAALAGDGTWFRNATTVHEHTTEAVPAIMSGQDPQQNRLPLLADHPDNVFTFLGGSYAMNVLEPVTQLCPSELCPRARDSFAGRMTSLTQDLAVVYGHVVLPDGLSNRLAPVTETWQGFGKEHEAEDPAAARVPVRNDADIDQAVGRQLWQDQRFQMEQYVASIEPTTEPTLFFAHAMLPHSPWRFLPSGRQYGDALGIDGIADDEWGDDEWLVEQGWQRHLLQTGLVDRLLGELVAKLKRTGLYDRSLVIVTADHGVSFRPGDRRRGITATNIGDIGPVPLFVKRPGEHKGQIVDRNVRTTDIVPTIADVLGETLPFHSDGRSLFDPSNDRSEVSVHQRSGPPVTAPADEVMRLRDETAARKLDIFGSRDEAGLYAFGPDAALVGTAPDALPAADANGLSATIDGEPLLHAVDLSSALVPAHVSGSLEGDGARPGVRLVIAVNGRIAGVGQSFDSNGAIAFSSYLPESAFRQGANDLQVFAVTDGRLALLGGTGSGPQYTLAGSEIEVSGSASIPIVPGTVEGTIEDWFFERDAVRFGGWAGDLEQRIPAERVLVFADGELVHSGTPGVGRTDLARRYPGLGRSGFVFDLPHTVIGDGGDVELRFFAVRGGKASELTYARDFPWRGSG
jgi:Sulfatase